MLLILDSKMTRPHLRTLKQTIQESQNKTTITTKAVLSLAVEQGHLLKRNEVSWFRELIKYLPTKQSEFCTIKFLITVKNKKRRSHKRQSGFYFKLFELLGSSYSQMKIKRYL